MVLQEDPQKMALPYSPIRLAPRDRKPPGALRDRKATAVLVEQKKRIRAEENASKGTENSSEEGDSIRSHSAKRKNRDRPYTR